MGQFTQNFRPDSFIINLQSLDSHTLWEIVIPWLFFYLHGMGGMLHIVWTYIDWHASRRSLRQIIVWLYTCMCRGPLQRYTATLCTFDLCLVHHRPALCTIVNEGVTLQHVATACSFVLIRWCTRRFFMYIMDHHFDYDVVSLDVLEEYVPRDVHEYVKLTDGHNT